MGRADGEPIIAGVGAVEVVTRVADAIMANVGRAIVNKDEEIRFCLFDDAALEVFVNSADELLK